MYARRDISIHFVSFLVSFASLLFFQTIDFIYTTAMEYNHDTPGSREHLAFDAYTVAVLRNTIGLLFAELDYPSSTMCTDT